MHRMTMSEVQTTAKGLHMERTKRKDRAECQRSDPDEHGRVVIRTPLRAPRIRANSKATLSEQARAYY